MAILRRFPGYVTAIVLLFTIVSAAQANTSRYEFLPEQNMLVQTGGIAGVQWTYIVEGQFLLTVDLEAGTAAFTQVDANAVDDSPALRTLDPNEVFNMTALVGTVVDSGTSIRFEGYADDGSSVLITLTFADDTVNLKGQTTPPPNSADFFIFTLDAVAQRKYRGGTGEPNNPYQIATTEDLMLLGETPEDYDKHFILTADIDLDPNLPGRKVFDRAVIAPDNGTPFTGIFDGAGHTILHLMVTGGSYLGLFGRLESGAEVRDLGVVGSCLVGSGARIGGLVGDMGGHVIRCHSDGTVRGDYAVGGMVGWNGGGIVASYSNASVSGTGGAVGGLVGFNGSMVSGMLGEIIAMNVDACYSTGTVSGVQNVGGLVGLNGLYGHVSHSYSTCAVIGNEYVGGLVGSSVEPVTGCFWDTEVSGQTTSDGGTGKTTVEMQTASTFLEGGWDFVDETANGTEDIWKIAEGLGYPRLMWEKYSGGTGGPNDPYQIATAEDLMLLGETPEDYDKHFILTTNIDLDPNLPGGRVFDRAVIAPHTGSIEGYPEFQGTPFTGVFDSQGHTISHLTIRGGSYLGLFGQLGSWGSPTGGIRNLGLVDVNIIGIGTSVGGLVGEYYGRGTIDSSYSSGSVCGGYAFTGGLVGTNGGELTGCHSTCAVDGESNVGGLVGGNGGTVTRCYCTSMVAGTDGVGGFVGNNWGTVTQCYGEGSVSGDSNVGGLVGYNTTNLGAKGIVAQCYSTGTVNGNDDVGGLVGFNLATVTQRFSTGAVSGTGADQGIGGLVGLNVWFIAPGGTVIQCFWDVNASFQAMSDGGTGKTTAEMQTADTFLDAGWDFVNETANGTEDIWWILEGQDYPRLWWEAAEQ